MRSSITCFDCGTEPVVHWWAYIQSFIRVVRTSVSFFLASFRIYHLVTLGIAWCVFQLARVWYGIGGMVGIIRFTSTPDETLSNRAKVMWQAAEARGAEIQGISVFGYPCERFRVRFAGARWAYVSSVPLVPWVSTVYTQWVEDGYKVKTFFRERHIPVPASTCVKTLSQSLDALRTIQQEGSVSVVVKPRHGNYSRHTSIGVTTEDDMRVAFKKSNVIAHYSVVEEQLLGKVCRATVINGELAGFCAMSHPQVTGDGVLTIRELIVQKNARRNKRVQSELSLEKPDIYPLAEKGYILDTVLALGEVFELKQKAGWMYGGEGREMVHDVHPQLVKIIERAASLLNAQVVGFDIIIEDPESDPAPQKWGIIEANSMPYIEVHIMPTVGERVNVGLKIWDMWRDIPTLWR